MMHLPGFGPKRARRLYDELGIDSLEALRAAAEQQKLRGLRGFGAKVEEKLLEQLAAGHDGRPAPRVLLSRALPIAEQVVDALRAVPGAERVEVAGSLRRQADSVKDLDVIATAADPTALVRALTELPVVESVDSSGDAGARVTTHSGLKVDLKVVEPDQFGNVLQHFTGSKEHNVALREAAVKARAARLGVRHPRRRRPARRCAARPRRRSTRSSGWRGSRRSCARAAASSRPPPRARCPSSSRSRTCAATCTATRRCRTAARTSRRWSRARARAATSTSRSPTTRPRTASATTSTPDTLRAQIERVRALDAELDGFDVLIGTETNVLTDGSLDYDDELLGGARLDRRLGAHVVRDVRAGDDRPDGRGDRASARRRDRPPDRAQDRDARAVRARRRARDRGGGAHAHDARDQRRARPPRPRTTSTRAPPPRRAC